MLAALLFIGALTGARRGELCALRWSDLDWQAGVLAIGRSVYETKGRGWGRSRQRPTRSGGSESTRLPSRSCALTEPKSTSCRRPRSQGPAGCLHDLLEVARGFRAGQAGRRVEVRASRAKAAGVDTHLHALRHFSATQLIAGGHDVRTVAGRLGHADAAVTLRVYSHVLPERDHEAAAALGRALALPK